MNVEVSPRIGEGKKEQEGGENFFDSVQSFGELFIEISRLKKGLRGSGKVYMPGELLEIIQEVRKGKKTVDYITNTGGLRKKVIELLAKIDDEKNESSVS
ncbi:MAG: hypothetical protein HYV45_03410 [Candidatus Moranbacteria bacterium]|nr:hypothetical protein [Candidatus Moranbacteria bacterium]